MFLPYADTPNPTNYRPYVTWGLMAVNIAVYLLITLPLSGSTPDLSSAAAQEFLRVFRAPPTDGWSLAVFEHGYQPGAASVVDLFSAMFMHSGLMHLAGNMLFLWIYGDNVEHRLGRPLFLAAYLGTGVVATLAFAAFAGDSLVPLVGASGAISGVLGCYFLMFPRNRVKVFIAFFPFIFTTILVRAQIVLGIFLVIDNIFPALLSSGSNVAYGAHIGGFVAGLAVAALVDRTGLKETLRKLGPTPKRASASWRRPAGAPGATGRTGPRVVTVGEAGSALALSVDKGERVEAMRLARQLHPDQILKELGGETVRLAEWLADAGDPILAMTLLRRALGLPRDEIDQSRVYLTLGLVRLQQGQTTTAYQHLLDALDSDPDPETDARARAALGGIQPN